MITETAIKMTILAKLTVFLAGVIAIQASENVPVLLWGSNNWEEVEKPLAGHSVSADKFVNDVLRKMVDEHHQDDVLLFVQKQLSMDELSQNTNAYNDNEGGSLDNVKSLMSSHPSLYLPRVINPYTALSEWKAKFSGKIHELTAPFNVKDLPLSDEKRNLIVVNLPESTKLSDDIMHGISLGMTLLSRKYNALYTGESSNKIYHVPLYTGRHLLQADVSNETYHFYNESCMFFYADSIVFRAKSQAVQNDSFLLTPDADSSESTCNPAVLVLNFMPVDTLTKLKLTITFRNDSTGYWYANTWIVSYTMSSATKNDVALKIDSNIYAPFRDSWHCTDPKIQGSNSSDKATSTVASFTFKNLQIQGYQFKKDQFGRANDCVGFFTIPIWSGLIATSVLLMILAFGIHMLASINTMDRFDDPKGKTITVNVSD